MIRNLILPALLAANIARSAETCYDYINNTIRTGATERRDYYACNDSTTGPDGVQSCCENGWTCGPDSICKQGISYKVGGCTLSTFEDPLCRTSCGSEYNKHIQYNYTLDVWQCCGDEGCRDPEKPMETFSAVDPDAWSAAAATSMLVPISTSRPGRIPTTWTIAAATGTATSSSTASSSDENYGAGAKVVGVIAIPLVLIAAAVFFVAWGKTRAQKRAAIEAQASQPPLEVPESMPPPPAPPSEPAPRYDDPPPAYEDLEPRPPAAAMVRGSRV